MDATDVSDPEGGRPIPRWIVIAAAVVVAGLLLYALRAVFTPVFFGFLIAYLLDPLVDRLEEWRLPRGLAITVILVVFLAATGIFLLLFVPAFAGDVAEVAKDVPAKLRELFDAWEPVLAERGIPVPHSLSEATEQLSVDAQDVAGRAAGPAMQALQWVVGGTASVVGAVLGLLMIPIFAFYLLYDFDRIVAYADGLVPPRHRSYVRELAREVDATIGLFVRGQLAVMTILAALYATGYTIVGIRLAVPIGILAGLLSFIPYVGAVLGVGLALAMCGLHFEGWHQVIGVCVVYGVVQLLEGFVITPKILGDKVGLSSLWVLLALMIGGELFGFLGVLLAVPVAAVVKIFVSRGLGWYRGSEIFGPGDEVPEAADTLSDADSDSDSDDREPTADSDDREPTADSDSDDREPTADSDDRALTSDADSDDREPTSDADDRAPTTESREPSADDREPTSDDREPTADDRKPTADSEADDEDEGEKP